MTKMELSISLRSEKDDFKPTLKKFANMISTLLFLDHDIQITETSETKMYEQITQQVKSIADSKSSLYKMTFEDFEDGVLYEYFRIYINSADITIMLTFTSAMNTRSWIDVCLIVENIDAESIFNNHYTFELSKFIPTIYRSIFDVLINNFNMKYDSIKINRMIEYLEPEDK